MCCPSKLNNPSAAVLEKKFPHPEFPVGKHCGLDARRFEVASPVAHAHGKGVMPSITGRTIPGEFHISWLADQMQFVSVGPDFARHHSGGRVQAGNQQRIDVGRDERQHNNDCEQ